MNPEPPLPLLSAELERELSEFSYIVSHDLAAACRHLAQFSNLLVHECGDLTPAQQSFVMHIEAASGKCQAMMKELLVFSRTQQRELKCAPFDARLLVGAANLQLSSEVRNANAEIKVGSLGIVLGDSDLLALMFKHILANALKFRCQDRPLRIDVSATQNEGRWIGHIADNGIGLAPDLREKAFRMFWQLSAQRGQPGVGAGLAICRRIARRHGGEVRFVDREQGACVEITLQSGERIH
jgi:light-regulated signal transduction histidine kinase (bacteriophytochrome)